VSEGTGSRDWDPATYDRISDPQFGWALEQLERLPLRGDEVVLDAGCGSGRVTAVLADRVPRGRVYGVDSSEAMVEHARRALRDRATVLCQDLPELELPEPLDAIFSNATFHWIHDHGALFAALKRSMKRGARLVAQCGGEGNIEAFRQVAESVAREEPFDQFFAEWTTPWNYAGDRESAVRLADAGFADVRTWLQRKRVEPERAFVETVCLLPYLKRLSADLGNVFVDRVIKRAGDPLVLEYVRLNMTAVA
jgi:trans-aconitate 2-methyltransferase